MCHVMPNHLHECFSDLCNLNLLRWLEGSIGSCQASLWCLEAWRLEHHCYGFYFLWSRLTNKSMSTIIKLASQLLKISTVQSTTLNQEVPYTSISYNPIKPGKDFIAFQSLTLSTKVMKPCRMRWNLCGTTWSWPWILRGCDVGRFNPKVILYFMRILGKLTLFRPMEWNLVRAQNNDYASQLVV